MAQPLLIIDGNSFAHRAYHGVPKTIMRQGGKGGGAIVGFANFLIRLYESERPRAVLVGWDTLDAPTYRHAKFPAYQSGRHFDDALVEQLDALPQFVAACGFANAKAPGYEADDFLAAAVAKEEKRGGTAIVASGDRDTFQLASERTTILHPVRAGEMARIGPPKCASATASTRRRCPISLRCAATLRTSCRAPRASVPSVPRRCCAATAASKRRSPPAVFRRRRRTLRLYRSIATMDAAAPIPPLRNQTPTWAKAAALARAWELNALAERLEGCDIRAADSPRASDGGHYPCTMRQRIPFL